MEFELKHYGRSGYSPSSFIEMIITAEGTTITEDVTDRNSAVDESFIQSLRDIADELEEQNQLIENENY